jgi:DNA N-6-adenine-methyltransferase Dam
MGGHERGFRGASDEWLTPKFILDALGPFDLDPCASVVRPWPTAARHFTVEDDGFVQDWGAARVWLNPPYGPQTARWLGRLADHGKGTALIFARTETRYFFDYVWERATALLFLKGRVNFCRTDGTPGAANSGAPSVLVAYGFDDAAVLAASSEKLAGHFVLLRRPGC